MVDQGHPAAGGQAGPGARGTHLARRAADPEVAAGAAKGASVVYQRVYTPYARWPERFRLLQRGVLAAAERPGALLEVLENLCGYGPAGGKAGTPREKEKDLPHGSVLDDSPGRRVRGVR